MMDNEEIEMLLDEIPHATSHYVHHNYRYHCNNHHVYGDHGNGKGSLVTQTSNGIYGVYDNESNHHHYKYGCASSPVNCFSVKSDGSSSSWFSGGHSASENGSSSPTSLDELKAHITRGNSHCSRGWWLDSISVNSPIGKKLDEGSVDELGLCRDFGKMYVGKESDDYLSSYGGHVIDQSSFGMKQTDVDRFASHDSHGDLRKGFSEFRGHQPTTSATPLRLDTDMNLLLTNLQRNCRMDNLLEPCFSPSYPGALFSGLNNHSSPLTAPWQETVEQRNQYYKIGSCSQNLSTSFEKLPMGDALLYGQQNVPYINKEKGMFNLHNPPWNNQARHDMENVMGYGFKLANGRHRESPNMGYPQGNFEAVTAEGSVILQGEGLSYKNKGFSCSRCQNRGYINGAGMSRHLNKRSQLDGRVQNSGICQNAHTTRMFSSYLMALKYNSLAEAQGYIYLIAKDQHGCRFLQKLFDEGTPQDVQIIFKEIIDHVVELMMNPFGNYLLQKLLDVCNEEQRMQILLMATEEPGELVQICLNTHGTRVVQKLIETLRTKQQISLVISALQPGFLVLIMDSNGNHVIQRCLQCLSNEDNKFIFVAAAKHCVDIATHQHSCCVLQRCIGHSTGEYQEKLVAEISANGLLLAQDPYGNYVVQFILELKISSATSKLIAQFEGNYVHLSTQKFSSHVVEKCLVVFEEENQSRIIHELLSSSRFGQLLQDPLANYVIQTALRVYQGPLYNSLVEAIESHRAALHNNPYSKKIYSQKLRKK